jgi:hypothetical protein
VIVTLFLVRGFVIIFFFSFFFFFFLVLVSCWWPSSALLFVLFSESALKPTFSLSLSVLLEAAVGHRRLVPTPPPILA